MVGYKLKYIHTTAANCISSVGWLTTLANYLPALVCATWRVWHNYAHMSYSKSYSHNHIAQSSRYKLIQ